MNEEYAIRFLKALGYSSVTLRVQRELDGLWFYVDVGDPTLETRATSLLDALQMCCKAVLSNAGIELDV